MNNQEIKVYSKQLHNSLQDFLNQLLIMKFHIDIITPTLEDEAGILLLAVVVVTKIS